MLDARLATRTGAGSIGLYVKKAEQEKKKLWDAPESM